MRGAILILFGLALGACRTPPPEPAPKETQSFYRVFRQNTPCRVSCGAGACVMAYDQFHNALVECTHQFADACVCVSEGPK